MAALTSAPSETLEVGDRLQTDRWITICSSLRSAVLLAAAEAEAAQRAAAEKARVSHPGLRPHSPRSLLTS